MTDKRKLPRVDLDSIAESLGFAPILLPADIPFDAAIYEQVLKETPELMEIIKLRMRGKISSAEARKRAKSLHTIIAQRYAEEIQRRTSR